MLGNPVAQVTQADQNDMIFHGGGDSHLPLLAACPAVKEQIAEIGKSLGQDDDANQRHQKMKYLKTRICRKFSRGLQKGRRQDDKDRLGRAFELQAFLREFFEDRIIQQPAPDNCHRKY